MNTIKYFLCVALLACGLGQSALISAQVQSMGDYSALLSQTDLPVVVKFFKPGCPPCGALAPIYFSIASDPLFEGKVIFIEVNVSAYLNVARANHVATVPTIIYYKDGVEVLRHGSGVSRQQIVSNIQNYLLS